MLILNLMVNMSTVGLLTLPGHYILLLTGFHPVWDTFCQILEMKSTVSFVDFVFAFGLIYKLCFFSHPFEEPSLSSCVMARVPSQLAKYGQ